MFRSYRRWSSIVLYVVISRFVYAFCYRLYISYFRAIAWAIFFYLILFVVVAFVADEYSPTDEVLAVSAIIGWLVCMPLSYYAGVWLASRRFYVVLAGNRIELTDKDGFSSFFDMDQVDKEVRFYGLVPKYFSIHISGSKEKLYGKIFPFTRNAAFSALAIAVRDHKKGWGIRLDKPGDKADLLQKDHFAKGDENKWRRNLSLIFGVLEILADISDAFL